MRGASSTITRLRAVSKNDDILELDLSEFPNDGIRRSDHEDLCLLNDVLLDDGEVGAEFDCIAFFQNDALLLRHTIRREGIANLHAQQAENLTPSLLMRGVRGRLSKVLDAVDGSSVYGESVRQTTRGDTLLQQLRQDSKCGSAFGHETVADFVAGSIARADNENLKELNCAREGTFGGWILLRVQNVTASPTAVVVFPVPGGPRQRVTGRRSAFSTMRH